VTSFTTAAPRASAASATSGEAVSTESGAPAKDADPRGPEHEQAPQ
jgi:hypothetical protein